MTLVPHRTKVSYSTFKKLPLGAAYYLASDRTGPFVKMGPRLILPVDEIPQVDPSLDAGPANINTSVIRADGVFKREAS